MAKKMKNSDQRGRFEYLQALVNEFQTTKTKGIKIKNKWCNLDYYLSVMSVCSFI